MRALLIGESYGINEKSYNHPFVGRSGQELSRMCGESELTPTLMIYCKHCSQHVPFGHCSCGYYNPVNFSQMVHHWSKVRSAGVGVTNVFMEHPPGDNEQLFFGSRLDDVCLDLPAYQVGSKKLYLLKSHRYHYDTLENNIRQWQPNVLVLLGNTACWAVLGRTGINKTRGTIIETKFGTKAIVTYHPAALRDWKLRPIIVSDLKKANSESKFSSISRPEHWMTINATLDEIKSWFDNFHGNRLACDIESGLALFSKSEIEFLRKRAPKAFGILTQLISMVGFAKSYSEALVIQFFRRSANGGIESHWPNKSMEADAWKWVQYGLSTGAELIFQNGMYDVNRLILSGIRPKNIAHDTMLLHHALLPEMPKGLGFLDSIYQNDTPWKTDYGSESLKRDD